MSRVSTRNCQRFASAIGVAVFSGIGFSAVAQDTDFEIGFRPMILGSRGEPANDMLGAGLVGAWHWRDDWYFGVGLDSFMFDYERPHQALESSRTRTSRRSMEAIALPACPVGPSVASPAAGSGAGSGTPAWGWLRSMRMSLPARRYRAARSTWSTI